MTIQTARAILGTQDKRVRALNGKRFVINGYEYRLTYCGGFATTVKVDRRKVGRRNFGWYITVGCHDCYGADDAFEKIQKLLDDRLHNATASLGGYK